MSAPSAPAGDGQGQKTGSPPEPRFWRHYSPHNELPLSGVTSVVLHSMVGALLLFGGLLVTKIGLGENTAPLPLDAIVIGSEGGSPGDGQPEGGNDPGKPKLDEVGAKEPQDPKDPLVKPPELPTVPVDPTIPSGPERFLPPPPEIPGISQIGRENPQPQSEGPAGKPGIGGSHPGPGTGQSGGVGTGTGTGSQIASEKRIRMGRWSMIFETRNGEEYLAQLAALQALLAVPQPDGGFKVFDLAHRPYVGKPRDIRKINRICWADKEPESVANLARALGIPFTPPYVIAYFPQTVEDDLAAKEKKFGHRQEEEIRKTVFKVLPRGRTFEVIVFSQDLLIGK